MRGRTLPVLVAQGRRSWAPLLLSVPAALLAATVYGGRAEVSQIVALVGIGLALWLPHGVVDRDFRSGVSALWLQRPVSPAAFYLSRLGSLLVILGVALTAMLLATAPLTDAPVLVHLRRGVGTGAPHLLVAASAVFALSAWGARADSLLALAVVYYAGAVANDVLIDPGAFGSGGPVAATLRLPLPEIETLGHWVAGEGMITGHAVWRVGAFAGAWLALGAAGVELRSRRPPGTPGSD